ncbi:MAG: beta-propeller domain-containing protein [Thermosphaera aggregans]|uniref:beta-propeller domain-containing protein n=1 Tax=Thermosphaera aggregans TaxID=54254 RepID=UPI003C074D4C
MRKHVFITLALATVLIGAFIPPLMTGFLGREGSKTTAAQTLQGTSPAYNLEGLKRFGNYDELYRFLEKALTASRLEKALSASWWYPRLVITSLDLWGAPRGEVGSGAGSQQASRTNVQVEGVDEPDVVKTNGELVIVASGNKVFVISTGEKVVKSVIAFEAGVKGLFLYEEKLVVFTESYGYYYDVYYYEAVESTQSLKPPLGVPELRVYFYNITIPEAPVLLGEVSVSGYMLGSRLLDKYVYLVANTYIYEPIIPYVNGRPAPLETLVAVDQRPDAYTVILTVDLEELVYATYTFLVRSGGWLYMSLRNLYIACGRSVTFIETSTAVLKAIAERMPPDEKGEVLNLLDEGSLDEAYERVNKYLSSLSGDVRQRLLDEVVSEINKEPMSDETTFYVFNVNGLSVSLQGSFTIPGSLLDQFAMEEFGDFFVVATTESIYEVRAYFFPALTLVVYEGGRGFEYLSSNITGTLHIGWNVIDTGNNVFVIDLESLNVTGSLRHLAPGERIYSARLIGDVFFLVTFRWVDPLFAIDVSDPGNPVVIGFLKIPGFSEYLHPLSNDRLLGIGVEEGGLKISLFNVTDPVNMSEIFKINLPSTWSLALYDHHAVTIHSERQLVLIPFATYDGDGVSSGVLVIKYGSDELRIDALLPHYSCVRTIYVGNELYTISPGLIKVFSLETYKELLLIPLTGLS